MSRDASAVTRLVTVGRAPQNDIVIDTPGVSGQHARLHVLPDGKIFVEDLQSTNGVFLNSPHNRISNAQISMDDLLYLGPISMPVRQLLATGSRAEPSAGSTYVLANQALIVGRDPQADIPVDHPSVSWHHARVEKGPNGGFITDLGSRNGTYVAGQAVRGRVAVATGQDILIGGLRFRFNPDGTFTKFDPRGNYTLEAVDVSVVLPNGRRLLNPLSFTVFPQELVALMGPAGAGKTTLLKALNGYTPLPSDQGRVLINGLDLNEDYAAIRAVLGYVPQDDIMHAQLTVAEALRYTARLRTDLRPAEIETRIQTVLTDLGIQDIMDRQIGSPERKVLSGGQRKRVNIAMELMSDPEIIFLDEPTSGLSSHDAEQVVKLLRRLADSGKTIIATIHQPSLDIYKLFDNLLMVARDKGDNPGVLAYYGRAFPDSIEFLHPEAVQQARQENREFSPEWLLSGLATRNSQHWHQQYTQHPAYRQYVVNRKGQSANRSSASAAKPKRGTDFTQWIPLLQRNILLKFRDRMQTILMLLQAPLLAVLVALSFRPEDTTQFQSLQDWTSFSSRLGSVHFLLVIAVIWFGCNNAARDIVGEWTVFHRERMVSVKLPSYLFSKMAALTLLCALQCAILLAIVYPACGLSAPLLPLIGTLLLSSLVGASIGLLISAVSETTEAAIMLLPIVLLPMIILGGGIKPIHEMKPMDQVSRIIPSRWAFETNFVAEASARKEVFTPSDCNEALNKQRDACHTILARIPSTPRLPTIAPKASTDDAAEGAFPKDNKRTPRSRALSILGGMAATLLALVLAVLRNRDVR